MAIPYPDARAARAHGPAAPRARLLVVPPRLQGIVAAVLVRDTAGAALDPPQRLSHFPASPLVCLSWFQGMASGLVRTDAAGRPHWERFGADVLLSGAQSRPTVSWTPDTGLAAMACFTFDAGHALFGAGVSGLHDRFVDAGQMLGTKGRGLVEGLRRATGEDELLTVLEHHLGATARQGTVPPLRQVGRHWVERITHQVHAWRATRSPRQVERRVRSWTGRSLRHWRALSRTEAAFHVARERQQAGKPLALADLAHEHGFADQAHLTRETRRITGFSPRDFAVRYLEDESFWLYRLWV